MAEGHRNDVELSTDSSRLIDISISRTMEPVPEDVRKILRKQANKFIRKQRVLESNMSKVAIKKRIHELEVRRSLDSKTVREIMLHPYFVRMIRQITEEMINEEGLWRRYAPNNHYRDTETTRRRIQSAIPLHIMEYAIKYSKKPWRYPGKFKIKTKFFDKLDWVENPFDVLEEKTESETETKTIVT